MDSVPSFTTAGSLLPVSRFLLRVSISSVPHSLAGLVTVPSGQPAPGHAGALVVGAAVLSAEALRSSRFPALGLVSEHPARRAVAAMPAASIAAVFFIWVVSAHFVRSEPTATFLPHFIPPLSYFIWVFFVMFATVYLTTEVAGSPALLLLRGHLGRFFVKGSMRRENNPVASCRCGRPASHLILRRHKGPLSEEITPRAMCASFAQQRSSMALIIR